MPGDLETTASCPLVVVPRRETTTRATAPVVVALDESPAARAAFAHGFATASRSRRRALTVLRCGPGAEPAGLAPMLAEFGARYPDRGVAAVRTDVEPKVALATASRTAALLVVGPGGRGRRAPGLFGSVSRDLIRRSASRCS